MLGAEKDALELGRRRGHVAEGCRGGAEHGAVVRDVALRAEAVEEEALQAEGPFEEEGAGAHAWVG